jgi:hypothetical protein
MVAACAYCYPSPLSIADEKDVAVVKMIELCTKWEDDELAEYKARQPALNAAAKVDDRLPF